MQKKDLKKYFFIVSLLLLCLAKFETVFAQKKSKKDFLITLETKYGPINLILYEKTKLHKENFLKLTQTKFYDSLLFHRVIPAFMIQGGDPFSNPKHKVKYLEYKVDAEFFPELFHKKGALAAARDNNPKKASSGSQFYIVVGKKMDENELAIMSKKNKVNYTQKQIDTYKNIGGTPHLDGNYTVFGEVLSGLVLVDSISMVKRNGSDRPNEPIIMKVKAVKMRKKKIKKKFGYAFEN